MAADAPCWVVLPGIPQQISTSFMTAVAEDVMELEIKVQGMTCDGCTSRVQDTLQVNKHMSLSASR